MGGIWLSECHRAFVPIPLSQELLSENMVVYLVYGDNYLKLGNQRLISLFTVLFAAPEGKMKQILYSVWMGLLWSCVRRKTVREFLQVPVDFNWDLGRWIIVVDCKPIKSTYFSIFRMKNEQAPLLLHLFLNARKEKRYGSFLILIGAKYFCSILNALLTTLVQSKWLDISLVLLCVFDNR